ncbi:MAG: oxygen-dependent coproporphyrinogen oxidase [Saprospiraceae bacterium]|nr:oxygen-dependent coproporphyrinogen oxidase [Saprospiraceae bacterium]
MKNEFITFIHALQDQICTALETIDGKAIFQEDKWQRSGGGGGKSRIIADGAVFEKGGVNTSVVHGKLPEAMKQYFNTSHEDFMACGISLVLHPHSPFVPTVHANFRYFELSDTEGGNVVDSWFGGGSDLTPSYIFREDGAHFHRTLKAACDLFGADLYEKYKIQCDNYFKNAHRNNEARGIGGIFYDYLRPNTEGVSANDLLAFSKSCGNAFLPAYLPIVERRKDLPYSEAHKNWQGIRRGRYVEFNLLHDKGTLFGLKTNGRIESVLMSLPPVANWVYDFQPEPNSWEAESLALLKPQNWVSEEMLLLSPYS